jgi:succinoglycan biosynthesis transport protein ExoP
VRALRRAGRTDTAFYRRLVAARQDLNSRILLGGRNSAVVQRPEQAEQTAPTPVRAGILGGVAGLVLGVLAAWLLQLRDRRVRVETDAVEALGGPPLARVPPISARVARADGVAALLEPDAPATEAYRRLATMLDLSRPRARGRGGGRVVMVTSAGASEGKTSAILNLAVVLSEMGERVAICDCDLRAPSVATRLRLTNEVGTADVLAGDRPVELVLQHLLPIGSLGQQTNGARPQGESRPVTVLPSGRVTSNPARLLGVGRLRRVFDALRGDHDVVLVDSPAWMAVGDGLAISRAVDEVLCVIKQGATAMPGLAGLAESLDAGCAPVVGYVLVDWRQVDGAGRRYEYGRHPGAGRDEEATSRPYALSDSLRPPGSATVTVSEAAALTGLSKAAVRQRIQRGSLASAVRDGQRLIPVSELERQGLLPSGGAQ